MPHSFRGSRTRGCWHWLAEETRCGKPAFCRGGATTVAFASQRQRIARSTVRREILDVHHCAFTPRRSARSPCASATRRRSTSGWFGRCLATTRQELLGCACLASDVDPALRPAVTVPRCPSAAYRREQPLTTTGAGRRERSRRAGHRRAGGRPTPRWRHPRPPAGRPSPPSRGPWRSGPGRPR